MLFPVQRFVWKVLENKELNTRAKTICFTDPRTKKWYELSEAEYREYLRGEDRFRDSGERNLCTIAAGRRSGKSGLAEHILTEKVSENNYVVGVSRDLFMLKSLQHGIWKKNRSFVKRVKTFTAPRISCAQDQDYAVAVLDEACYFENIQEVCDVLKPCSRQMVALTS